jgi:hypothetical protein
MSLLNTTPGYPTSTMDPWPNEIPGPGPSLNPTTPVIPTTPTPSPDNPVQDYLDAQSKPRFMAGKTVNPGMMMGNPSSMMAQILQEQWADYVNRIYPYRKQLEQMTSYTNPDLINASVWEASKQAMRTHDATQSAYDAKLRGYGVIPTGDVKESNVLQSQLARTASLADAANRIREKISERNRSIATGGVAERYVNG